MGNIVVIYTYPDPQPTRVEQAVKLFYFEKTGGQARANYSDYISKQKG